MYYRNFYKIDKNLYSYQILYFSRIHKMWCDDIDAHMQRNKYKSLEPVPLGSSLAINYYGL